MHGHGIRWRSPRLVHPRHSSRGASSSARALRHLACLLLPLYLPMSMRPDYALPWYMRWRARYTGTPCATGTRTRAFRSGGVCYSFGRYVEQQPTTPPRVLAERDAASNNCSSGSRTERVARSPLPSQGPRGPEFLPPSLFGDRLITPSYLRTARHGSGSVRRGSCSPLPHPFRVPTTPTSLSTGRRRPARGKYSPAARRATPAWRASACRPSGPPYAPSLRAQPRATSPRACPPCASGGTGCCHRLGRVPHAPARATATTIAHPTACARTGTSHRTSTCLSPPTAGRASGSPRGLAIETRSVLRVAAPARLDLPGGPGVAPAPGPPSYGGPSATRARSTCDRRAMGVRRQAATEPGVRAAPPRPRRANQGWRAGGRAPGHVSRLRPLVPSSRPHPALDLAVGLLLEVPPQHCGVRGALEEILGGVVPVAARQRPQVGGRCAETHVLVLAGVPWAQVGVARPQVLVRALRLALLGGRVPAARTHRPRRGGERRAARLCSSLASTHSDCVHTGWQNATAIVSTTVSMWASAAATVAGSSSWPPSRVPNFTPSNDARCGGSSCSSSLNCSTPLAAGSAPSRRLQLPPTTS